MHDLASENRRLRANAHRGVIARSIEIVGVKITALARALKTRRSILQRWMTVNETCGIPGHDYPELTRLVGDAPIEALCKGCGGRFVREVAQKLEPLGVLGAVGALMAHAGNTASYIAEAGEDGWITEEVEKVKELAAELRRAANVVESSVEALAPRPPIELVRSRR